MAHSNQGPVDRSDLIVKATFTYLLLTIGAVIVGGLSVALFGAVGAFFAALVFGLVMGVTVADTVYVAVERGVK